MKVTLYLFVLLISLHSCLSETDKDLQNELTEEESPKNFWDTVQEESRGTCIERLKDCTNNRHGCCRSRIFKDKCKCVKKKGSESCSCQQEYWFKVIEDFLGDIPPLDKPENKNCIAKHNDCSKNTNGCCNSSKLVKYQCKCYDLIEEDGKESQICGCVTTVEQKLLEQGFRWLRALYKKIG